MPSRSDPFPHHSTVFKLRVRHPSTSKRAQFAIEKCSHI
ncbi:hypothetical protein NPIL_620821, partial [Nephila pilipes]